VRLADQVLAAVGVQNDPGDMIANMARSIAKAQCFEISEDVYRACTAVCTSKPSSIASAIHLARLPYPKIWVERLSPPGLKCGDGCVIPTRSGFLAEQSGADPAVYTLTWVWFFPEHSGVDITPLSIGVSLPTIRANLDRPWDMPAPPPVEFEAGLAHLEEYIGPDVTISPRELAAILNKNPESKAWHNLSEEELQVRLKIQFFDIITPSNVAYMRTAKAQATDTEFGGLLDTATNNLKGERLVALAFLLMLNSPNALDRQPREDLSKLNRARAKAGKTRPLQEFIVTRLRLPKWVTTDRGDGKVGAAARAAHLVRGHFKVRRTGVFWWSPYLWGKGLQEQQQRKVYAVSM
jgi:hypothetical protein